MLMKIVQKLRKNQAVLRMQVHTAMTYPKLPQAVLVAFHPMIYRVSSLNAFRVQFSDDLVALQYRYWFTCLLHLSTA